MRTAATLFSLWFWVNTGINAAQTGEWYSMGKATLLVFSFTQWRHWTEWIWEVLRRFYPVLQVQSVGFLSCGARWVTIWGWSEGPRPHTDHIHGWSVVLLVVHFLLLFCWAVIGCGACTVTSFYLHFLFLKCWFLRLFSPDGYHYSIHTNHFFISPPCWLSVISRVPQKKHPTAGSLEKCWKCTYWIITVLSNNLLSTVILSTQNRHLVAWKCCSKSLRCFTLTLRL